MDFFEDAPARAPLFPGAGFERREGDIKDLDLNFLEDHALTIHLMSRKSEFYHMLYRQRVRRGTAIQIIEQYDPVKTTAHVYHVDPPDNPEAEKKNGEKTENRKRRSHLYYRRWWFFTSESGYCG